MSAITKYHTVSERTAVDLDRSVNSKLAEGFKLYGTPYSIMEDGVSYYTQAMIQETRPTAGHADWPT
jgi:hypothetical protein